ncbi:MFS transporter [Thermogymnomonas acidicola]|uniref:MFS transporter n=1 Tax=Thermogymnomonas acidicola TaxID=399579 RepID=A0AA37F9V0_9ARCH|nr:MFS transporter [Thermogymnomonas acidicola]GGM76450.1 MFS transporter [Thermogymnomonas acidicola]
MKNETIINLRYFAVAFGANTASSFVGVFGVLLGASAFEMGLLQALSNAISNASQIFWGRLSDRYGLRRPWLVGASVVMAGLWLAMGFVEGPYQLILLYSSIALTSSVISVNWFSLLADLTSSGSRGSFLARLQNISSFGNLASLLLMAFILHGDSRSQLIIPFSLGSAAYVASAVLLSRIVEVKKESRLSGSFVKGVREARANSAFFRYMTSMLAQGFFWSMAWPIFPITVVAVRGFDLPEVSALTAMNIFAAVAVQRYLGRLADRFNRVPLIFLNRLMLGAIPLMYAFFFNFDEFLVMEAYSGVASALQNVVMNSYLMDLLPEGKRAEYVSIMNGFNGIVYLFGSLAGGFLLQYLEGTMPLARAVSLSLTLISAGRFATSFLFLRLKEPENRGRRGIPIFSVLLRLVRPGLPSGSSVRER